MAEPFSKPTKQDLEKARELYSDPMIYFGVNSVMKALKEMQKPHSIDVTNTEFRSWKRLTRLMFLNIPAILIIEETYKTAEEVAEGTWKDFEVPDLTSVKNLTNVEISIDPFATEIKNQIKITDIAKKYRLKFKGNKAVCPFHNDKDPSLSLSDEKGLFHCFGCGAKGDIVTFYKMLQEVKDGESKST